MSPLNTTRSASALALITPSSPVRLKILAALAVADCNTSSGERPASEIVQLFDSGKAILFVTTSDINIIAQLGQLFSGFESNSFVGTSYQYGFHSKAVVVKAAANLFAKSARFRSLSGDQPLFD